VKGRDNWQGVESEEEREEGCCACQMMMRLGRSNSLNFENGQDFSSDLSATETVSFHRILSFL